MKAQGKSPTIEQLIADHPDLADELLAFGEAHQSLSEQTDETMLHTASDSDSGEVAATIAPPGSTAGHSGFQPTLLGDWQNDQEPPPSANQKSSGTIRQFGDYELHDEIARGGMGVVYKARQVPLNRTVAIKMILTGQLASKEDVARFYTEAEAAAKLQHAHIVGIYDVGETDGQHFFSMEFVDCTNLSDAITENPMPPRQAAAYILVLAQAIEYAHQNGILHRDLPKPCLAISMDL